MIPSIPSTWIKGHNSLFSVYSRMWTVLSVFIFYSKWLVLTWLIAAQLPYSEQVQIHATNAGVSVRVILRNGDSSNLAHQYGILDYQHETGKVDLQSGYWSKKLLTFEQCPPLATIWIYCIVQLNLGHAIAGLAIVYGWVYYKNMKLFF